MAGDRDKNLGKHIDDIRAAAAAQRFSTNASNPSETTLRTSASDAQIKAHLAELSLFCHHQGMTPEQAKVKLNLCVSDLRGASEQALATACKRMRTSDDPNHRFFSLGALLKFCRDAEREIAQAKRVPIPAPAGPLAMEIPPHPAALLELPPPSTPQSLRDAVDGLKKIRQALPDDVLVNLDAVREKHSQRRIAASKRAGKGGGDAA